MTYPLVEFGKLPFLLPVIGSSDDGDDEDGNTNSHTFHPVDAGSSIDSLVDTQGQRHNRSNRQQNDDLVVVGNPEKLEEPSRLSRRQSILTEHANPIFKGRALSR